MGFSGQWVHEFKRQATHVGDDPSDPLRDVGRGRQPYFGFPIDVQQALDSKFSDRLHDGWRRDVIFGLLGEQELNGAERLIASALMMSAGVKAAERYGSWSLLDTAYYTQPAVSAASGPFYMRDMSRQEPVAPIRQCAVPGMLVLGSEMALVTATGGHWHFGEWVTDVYVRRLQPPRGLHLCPGAGIDPWSVWWMRPVIVNGEVAGMRYTPLYGLPPVTEQIEAGARMDVYRPRSNFEQGMAGRYEQYSPPASGVPWWERPEDFRPWNGYMPSRATSFIVGTDMPYTVEYLVDTSYVMQAIVWPFYDAGAKLVGDTSFDDLVVKRARTQEVMRYVDMLVWLVGSAFGVDVSAIGDAVGAAVVALSMGEVGEGLQLLASAAIQTAGTVMALTAEDVDEVAQEEVADLGDADSDAETLGPWAYEAVCAAAPEAAPLWDLYRELGVDAWVALLEQAGVTYEGFEMLGVFLQSVPDNAGPIFLEVYALPEAAA